MYVAKARGVRWASKKTPPRAGPAPRGTGQAPYVAYVGIHAATPAGSSATIRTDSQS